MTAGLFAPSIGKIPFHIQKAGWVWPFLCVAFGVRLFGWVSGLEAGLLLLTCLLAHELGHVFMAWLLGVPTREVGLCLLGAYHRRAYSTRRRDEMLIAASGPLTNLLLSFPLLFVPHVGFQVSMCCFMLGVINLIPLPSSDGLRILRNLFNSAKARPPVMAMAGSTPK